MTDDEALLAKYNAQFKKAVGANHDMCAIPTEDLGRLLEMVWMYLDLQD